MSKGGFVEILNQFESSNFVDLLSFKNEFPMHSFVQNFGCSQTHTWFKFADCFELQTVVIDFSLRFVLSKL